jgi:hypothetical protein
MSREARAGKWGEREEKGSELRIPLKSAPIPKQTGTHCGANRQSEKSERSDAGNFVHSLGFSELQVT